MRRLKVRVIQYLYKTKLKRVSGSVRGMKYSRLKIVIGHASRGNQTILRLDELDRRASVCSKGKFFQSTAQPFFRCRTRPGDILRACHRGKEFDHLELGESIPRDCVPSA